jgi:hypothetical protein
MSSFLRYLLAALLLLSLTAAAYAQAGRYIPIPVSPSGGSPFLPHVPYHPHAGGDSSGSWVIGGVVGIVLGVLGAIFKGMFNVQDGGNVAGPAAAPAPDLIHEARVVAPKAEHTRRLLELLAHQDPLFEPTALGRWAEGCFLLVQECWQRGDYGPLGDLLLPTIRTEHESQLSAMLANGERNSLDGLRLEWLEFVHLSCGADPVDHELTALITFQAASYYVDARTGAFRRGSQVPTRFQEFWVFCRRENAWRLSAIERTETSTRLTDANRVAGLNEEQLAHAQQGVAL